MTKKFKLLKNISSPICNVTAGTIGEMNEESGRVYFDNFRFYYEKETVENNPEWFEEIKEEQPFKWSDKLAWEFSSYSLQHKNDPRHYHEVMKDFKASKTNSIKEEKYKQWDIPMNATITHNQSKPKANSIEEDGFEDLKKWVNQHQKVKWVSDLTFSFIYQNKQCHGMITYLPFHFEITIRSVRSTDDIGNGCGFAVYKKFPRNISQTNTIPSGDDYDKGAGIAFPESKEAEAFEAARLFDKKDTQFKYKTFQDYKKSQQ